jgi:hypothetical protein
MKGSWIGRLIFGVWLGVAATPLHAEPAVAEIDQLRKQSREQQDRIARLLAELEEARVATVQAKLRIDALEHRCKKLEDALAAERKKSGAALPVKKLSPGVVGKVTEVGRDGKLVQISIGLDAGLAEGQTLEVFRTGADQRPRYLGTLRLTRVDPKIAIGNFQGAGGTDVRLVVGDSVANELVPKN